MDGSVSGKPARLHFSRVEAAIEEVAKFHGLPRGAVEATPLPVFARLWEMLQNAQAVTVPGEAA